MKFVALDVETANENRRSICSIAMVKFDVSIEQQKLNNEPLMFHSLINPEEEFSPMNIGIHSITPEAVINAPTFPEIKNDIVDFIDNLPVVAHFVQFDFGALRDAYDKYSLEYDDIKYICSYFLSKFSLKNQINYKLNTLADYFNIPLNHHDARSDATACGTILIYLMIIKHKNNINDFINDLGYKDFGILGVHGFLRHTDRSGQKNKKYEHVQLTNEELNELNANHPFFGKHITFTGTLKCYTRDEARQAVEKIGANTNNTVTNKTNYLVIGDDEFKYLGTDKQTSKINKCIQKKKEGQEIEILSDDDFMKLLKS